MSLDRMIAGTQGVAPVQRAGAPRTGAARTGAAKAGAAKADAAKAGRKGAQALTLGDRTESFAQLFKAMGHEGRLTILCHLAEGERSVTALEALLGQRQAAVSQQLARLRLEGMVTTRREGKTIFYAIQDKRVIALLRCLPGLGT